MSGIHQHSLPEMRTTIVGLGKPGNKPSTRFCRHGQTTLGYQSTKQCRLSVSVACQQNGNGASPPQPDATLMDKNNRGRNEVKQSWNVLLRWSKFFRQSSNDDVIKHVSKVAVLGGGSFGTAMATVLAHNKDSMNVVMLVRDSKQEEDINVRHCNEKYLKAFTLPKNIRATTKPADALLGCHFIIHAVPAQHTRKVLTGIKQYIVPTVPVVSVSKGLEVGSGKMMSEVIHDVLGARHPTAYISGPSFAKEMMQLRPTNVVVASTQPQLARAVQLLFANELLRVNMTSDVTGVEMCGALKNVLAIAAGIVEGLDLGSNALAALIAQGCAEIRWLATRMGAKPTTVAGLAGLGDVMLTCYGSLSRNRTVGIRLGQGETLQEILASSTQVAEGVATAGVVVSLARRYRVSLPVLTAVAQILENELSPKEAVQAIMNLPQMEEHQSGFILPGSKRQRREVMIINQEAQMESRGREQGETGAAGKDGSRQLQLQTEGGGQAN